jgi:ATP-dependent helicase HrpA
VVPGGHFQGMKIHHSELPIYQQRGRILEELSKNRVIVVESPTGSGKTTQIPLILYQAGYAQSGVIGVTQPRRIAAVSVSDYIASQLESPVPGIVGYKMRFEDQTLPDTSIKIMTDGILLQELKADRYLSRYSVIMVDEAHERSLNIDFILGLLKEIMSARSDLKVIISSATINPKLFSDYFDGAPIVHIDTITYPVDIRYSPLARPGDPDLLTEKIADIVTAEVKRKEEGDILVFLSGEKPIKDAVTALQSSQVSKKLHILPLYGRLTKEEQERVFLPAPKSKTKVVVSTNISETSVTIDGISTVIDSGLAKINYYNPRTFTSSLIEGPVSKASCDQRKGRAGRTRPGTCYRLYDKKDYEHRDPFTLEEIFRTDLSEVVLRMAELGIQDFESFDFISPPGKPGIIGAVETLRLLDALTDNRELTRTGLMMVDFPLLPRLSKILVEAIFRYPGVIEEAIIVTAFLSTHTPYVLPPGEEMEARRAHHHLADPAGDFIAYIALFRQFIKQGTRARREHFCRSNYLDFRTMTEIMNIKEQLEAIVSEFGVPIGSGGTTRDILCTLSAGLLQFVCVRTGNGIYRSLTADRIQIHPGSCMFRESPSFIVAGEIVRTSRMFARSVSPLNRAWLEEISPDLSALVSGKSSSKSSGRSVGRKTEAAAGEKEKARDTSFQIKIGDKTFAMEKYKGKKKIALLPWEDIAPLVRNSETPPVIHENARGKIVYDGWEIHPGDRIASIIKIIPFIDPPKDLSKPPPGGRNFNGADDLEALCNHLDSLLRCAKAKKASKRLGFIALDTDNVGVYWYKVIKSFHTAVDVSLTSLECLADELHDNSPKNLVEKVGNAYRRISTIFESY